MSAEAVSVQLTCELKPIATHRIGRFLHHLNFDLFVFGSEPAPVRITKAPGSVVGGVVGRGLPGQILTGSRSLPNTKENKNIPFGSELSPVRNGTDTGLDRSCPGRKFVRKRTKSGRDGTEERLDRSCPERKITFLCSETNQVR